MLKIFLKHIIYEQCINVLFDQVRINFSDLPPRWKGQGIYWALHYIYGEDKKFLPPIELEGSDILSELKFDLDSNA